MNFLSKLVYICRFLVMNSEYRRSAFEWICNRIRDSGGPELVVTTRSGATFKLAEWRNLSEYRFWKKHLIPKSEALVIEHALAADNKICVDVGANMGLYSLYFAACGGKPVFALEPAVENFDRLVANVRRNCDLADRVVAKKLAASDSSESLLVKFNSASPGWSKIGSSGQQVEAVSLDIFCRDYGIERLALLKIDVEGFEMQVLKGAFHLLSDRRVATICLSLLRTRYEDMEEAEENSGSFWRRSVILFGR